MHEVDGAMPASNNYSDQDKVLVVRKDLSFLGTAGANKVFNCLIVALLVCVLANVVVLWTKGAFASFALASFLPLLFGALTIFGMSAASKLLSRRKRELIQLQNKLVNEPTDDICRDLQKIVSSCLALKHFEGAEFYSQKLLQQSALDPAERLDCLAESVLTLDCWVSKPGYHKKANYYLVWLFESSGTVAISGSRLRYVSKQISVDIDLADIREVSVGSHSRWLKPIPTSYIVLKFTECGVEQTVFLTPKTSNFDTIFDINAAVEVWLPRLRRACEGRIAMRAMNRLREQVPGLESSNEQAANPHNS